ncbi:MAG: ligand-binding sensor domain-containing protein [Saprospiraceae bacterium]
MRFRFTLLCCHLVAMLGAQSPQFLHYGLTDGLPSNQVYCIEQDRNGMIWLGTDNGLARFDGRAFRNFQVQDGIPDPEVLNLKTDHEGRLWISCFRKSACFYMDGRFSTEKNNPDLAKIRFSSAINALFVDTLTGIWFTGTDYTVCNWRAGRVRTFKSTVLTSMIRKIGGVFFAFSRTHIARFEPTSGQLDTVMSLLPLIDSSFILRGIAVSGNRVLYSTSRGLWLFEWDGGKFRVADILQMETGNVFVDQRGRFWLGTNTIGAVCFDNPDRSLSNPRIFLPGEKITNVFEDRQGALWFGTTGNGVFVLPPQYSLRFTKEDGLPSNNITAVLRLPDGALLAGDEAGNLLRISNGGIQLTPLTPGIGYNRVRNIQRLPNGQCLIVSDFGFFLQARDRIRFLSGRPSGKAGLIEGGALFAGTSTALESVDLTSLASNMLVRRRTTALAQCGEGVVWQAGVDGLYSDKDQFLRNFSTQFPLLKCRITALEYQKPNTLIIGTSDAGLLKAYIRQGGVDSVRALPTENRLNPPQIRSLFLDEAGTIWSATPEGVHWLRPDGKRGRVSVFQGLIDNDVNAVWAEKDTLWAATRYGLSIIPLNRLKKNVVFDDCYNGLE